MCSQMYSYTERREKGYVRSRESERELNYVECMVYDREHIGVNYFRVMLSLTHNSRRGRETLSINS